MKVKFALLSVFLVFGFTGFAQLRLPKIVASGMVLQRDKPITIWGWETAGQIIKLSFAGQQKITKADSKGYWKVILSSIKANGEPQEMVISASTIVKLNNILIGEVWLCSGQSNMEYPMNSSLYKYAKPVRGIDSAELELKKSYPNIRLFLVEKKLSNPDVTSTGWNQASGEALERFSAAGFYFAKSIQKELNVPIGVISSSWGGSRIEPWISPEEYKILPAFFDDVKKDILTLDGSVVGKNYSSMIAPLIPFALRGFFWYQGESNAMINDGIRYSDKMQALVDGWRNKWADQNLPFYSVQIAPYYYTKRKDKLAHTPEMEAEFWEAQYQSLKIPKTGIVATMDLVDNLADIHPPYKWEVGRRLALLALDKEYKKDVISSGPVFKAMKVKNGKAILSFRNNEGLKSSDDKELSWFTISGEDGKFLPALAKIDGKRVIVSAPGIAKPVGVRFAWDEKAMPNFVNEADLPAVPFRTKGISWKYVK